MATWREEVEAALLALDGQGTLEEIYIEVSRSTTRDLPRSWKAIIRRELEDNSSDSENYKGKFNLFYSVDGIGAGVWGLRNAETKTPNASDIVAPASRVATEIYRILRDTELARRIKKLYDNSCQLCGTSILLPTGQKYSEAHHIRPLGAPHNGPDLGENIIILCPNHHVQCDYGAIPLYSQNIMMNSKHKIGQSFIDYHNAVINLSSKSKAKTNLN